PTEVWNNVGSSGPVYCDPTVSLSKGDLVELGLNFTPSGSACLTLIDLRSQDSHNVCQAQPDSGASSFQLMSSTANSNGYFTGPMTEVVNGSTSSCPDYRNMPLVSYLYNAPQFFTRYIPWSDEWEYQGAGTYCYGSSNGTVSLFPGDYASHYADTAGSSGYGPHWLDGQNYSLVNASFGLKLQTDPSPLTGVTDAASKTSIATGEWITITSTPRGGVGPYGALWFLNASSQSVPTPSWNWSASAPGTYRFSSYATDSQGDVAGLSNVVTVAVVDRLTVSGVNATPLSTSADVGQSVDFSVVAAGGVGSRQFVWSGLPTGCSSTDSASVTCIPSGPGASNVSVSVWDSNGTKATSSSLSYRVFSDPVVTLLASVSSLDSGEKLWLNGSALGGSGGLIYQWTELPAGCAAALGPDVSCRPLGPASVAPQLSVVDSNGVHSNASVALVVHADPSVTIVADRSFVDVGETFHVVATYLGGMGAPGYFWAALAAGCGPADSANVTCTPQSPGTLAFNVSVNDATGATALSPTIAVATFPRLVANFTVSPRATPSGENATLTAIVTGGSGGLSYSWAGLPPGCTGGNVTHLSCPTTFPGTYPVTLTIHDSSGASANITESLVVAPPVTAPPSQVAIPGVGAMTTSWLLVALVLGAVIAIALFARRRRPVARAVNPARRAERPAYK
ncbi:MAG: PKD domain-containing protein, partial [Thermoplasmata archaeon]|nr:PKD domain-containing protein [Thermoplasmata archaeon]